MLTYQWQGIEEAIGRVQTLASLSGLENELEAEGDAVVTEAQAEPPERPEQRYVRSHRLSGAWHRGDAQRSGRAVRVDVTNPTLYGPYVQGEEQAPVHVGRWKRLRTIGENRRGAIRARIGAWALKTWRGG